MGTPSLRWSSIWGTLIRGACKTRNVSKGGEGHFALAIANEMK
jgi:hypothetical protein